MAIYACILAEVATGLTFDAVHHLKNLESIGLVVPTTGPYDLMIIAQASDAHTLGKAIITEIQQVPGIHSTLTLLILDQLEPHNWLIQLLKSTE